MGSSFVLRDRAGRPAGYVMQGMGVIRCRAGALAQTAGLTLLCGSETAWRALTGDGQEQTWPDDGRTLTGAYVASEDTLVLDTGEEARRAFERDRRSIAARAAPVRRSAETERPAAAERPVQTRSVPQRRWPPPPCWPEARYVDGRWQSPVDQTSG